MSYVPTTDPEFLGPLERWFQSQSEILVLIRVRCGGGAKDFELFSIFEALLRRIHELPLGTCITAFRQPQLPLRGVVDDEFIAKCLDSVPDGSEYLMVETVRHRCWSDVLVSLRLGRDSPGYETTFRSHAEFRLLLDFIRQHLMSPTTLSMLLSRTRTE